jgi:hypothetical protein
VGPFAASTISPQSSRGAFSAVIWHSSAAGKQIEQNPDRRRLAGAVRAEESEHLPRPDGDRHVLDPRALP